MQDVVHDIGAAREAKCGQRDGLSFGVGAVESQGLELGEDEAFAAHGCSGGGLGARVLVEHFLADVVEQLLGLIVGALVAAVGQRQHVVLHGLIESDQDHLEVLLLLILLLEALLALDQVGRLLLAQVVTGGTRGEQGWEKNGSQGKRTVHCGAWRGDPYPSFPQPDLDATIHRLMGDSLIAECEQVLVVRDRASAAEAIVAVHSTKLGPAHGGIRRWAYADRDAAMADVVALARAMTFKCALAEIPAGGGKAVILDHGGLDREGAYRLVGRTVEQLGGAFYTGPDVNTTAQDLRWVGEETRFVATDAADGPGDLAAATADGVLSAWLALAAELELAPADLHCVVQGLGAVGMGLCQRLAALGARLSVYDVVASRVEHAVANFGAKAVLPDQLLQTACDIFSPCAMGGVLTETVAASLPARGVCGAANNVFASEAAADVLHRRSVPVVPDFLANAGALIQGAIWNLQQQRIAPERLQRIGVTTREILRRSRGNDRAPSQVALELARERLER